MNWNSLSHKNILLSGLSLLLCAAIVLGLIMPAANMHQREPLNPLDNEGIREITILKVGDDVSDLDDIVVPNEDSAAPTEPEETRPEETKPPETEHEESKTEETKPDETIPTQNEATTPDTGEEDEGNDQGNQGEQGGEVIELELAAVMTWYKYGTDPQTIACGSSATVSKSINIAQLESNTLKYDFTLTGTDAKYVQITNVTVAAGDAAHAETSQKGSMEIELPGDTGTRNYTFTVTAAVDKTDEDGESVRQELSFTFVLKFQYDLDLDLELTWRPKDGNVHTVGCGPDKTERFSVKNYDLTERVFSYDLALTGSLAENAQIVSVAYTTESGEKAGDLAGDSGTLILDPVPGSDRETYHMTVTVKTADRIILYRYQLNYQETLDVQLAFHWMEKGTTRRTKVCEPAQSASLRIKNNQLSAGAVAYELELTGVDGTSGRILSAAYTSESGESGNLEPSGSLPLSMPDGASSNKYHITVSAIVNGQRVNFEVILHYSADVSLEMEYTVREEGTQVTRQIICENTRSKTAESIYDDQLNDGVLRYKMRLIGDEAKNIAITSVTCYQSGSGKTVSLDAEGEITMRLKDGKTGENTFDIQAQDDGGNTYRFSINIPYKHRGENRIKIAVNLTDGQQIINETKTNLTVQAWSEDESGSVIDYIPANGTDTKLIVKFDGETLDYVSSSGASSEYDLYPVNPEVGDTNTHTLYIYAEDALGNYGELTLHLNGQRRESGQKIGKATIYVDMSVLGLGVVANLNYDVLADEPVSYVIAKALMGVDTGEPFGAASNTLSWGGRYAGTLDSGFYLQSLTTGHTASALEGSTWPGSGEEDVLQAIDGKFGAGTGLATLWRCLYRNGLNKSSGSGNSFGEFDYTSGSGWMYSIGGQTYYPGQSMSSVYLKDGDVLTVRYTLAYGWDVGGGSPGYGSTVGYCVSAVNGSIRVNHRMETVVNADGSVSNVCHCCGIMANCAHADTTYTDLDDGTHIEYCNDCKKEIGDPADHGWVHEGKHADTSHRCEDCGATENHKWKEVEGSNTATCTVAGTRSVQCSVCNMIREEEAAPKGHSLDNRWQVTAQEHYEKCSVCGEITNQGRHQYKPVTYKENGAVKETFECQICSTWHVDECSGSLTENHATCQKVTYHCSGCGYDLTREGFFDEYHRYKGGSCEYCGEKDPNGGATEPPATQPPETEPPATEPPETQPPETEPPATQPPETEPPETEPPETVPPATEPPKEEETLAPQPDADGETEESA